jgi:hypothetical protein
VTRAVAAAAGRYMHVMWPQVGEGLWQEGGWGGGPGGGGGSGWWVLTLQERAHQAGRLVQLCLALRMSAADTSQYRTRDQYCTLILPNPCLIFYRNVSIFHKNQAAAV